MKPLSKFFFALLALILFISCGKQDPHQNLDKLLKAHAQTDINQFILDKFKDHHIIMMADSQHDQGIYSRNVTSFLNYWLEAAQNGNTDLKNLVLILESDSLHTKDIKKYLVSHELRDLIGDAPFDVLSNMSTADLEFYWALGELQKKIDQADATGGNIKFDILGPEIMPDFENWTAAQADSWFVNTRDTVSSNNIIKYLKTNPDTKALIFYGGAHLAKGRVPKRISSGSAEGYFMAHYLEEKFGKELYVIGQVGDMKGALLAVPEPLFIAEAKYSNQILSLVFNRKLDPYEGTDAIITISGDPEPTVSWAFIKSKTIGWLSLDEIKNLNLKRKLFRHNKGAEPVLYLLMLTGNLEFIVNRKDSSIVTKNIPVWEKWLGDPKNDVVKDIVAMAPAKQLLELMKTEYKNKEVEVESELLFSLTTGLDGTYNFRKDSELRTVFTEHYDNEFDWPSKFEYDETRLNKASNRIIVTDLVHLLWVGTDQEKQEAVAELHRRTGQTFISAPEWMKWWRENYERL